MWRNQAGKRLKVTQNVKHEWKLHNFSLSFYISIYSNRGNVPVTFAAGSKIAKENSVFELFADGNLQFLRTSVKTSLIFYTLLVYFVAGFV